jgi:hypothetical protein
MSIEEFAKITPVNPPRVKRKMNPKAHRSWGANLMADP